MKRFLKLFSVILTAAILLTSLLACGTNTDPKPSDEPNEEGTVDSELLYTEYDTSCIKKFGNYKEGKITKDLTVTEDDILDEYLGAISSVKQINIDDENTAETAIAVKNNYDNLLIRSGVVKNGDIINFDYEGFLDGEAFSGGKAAGSVEMMGRGHFVPTFEDQIIGHSVGESFEINVKFPENYNETLAGKDTVFKIKVNYIIPGICDDTVNLLAKFFGKTYATAEAYKASVKSELQDALNDEFEEYFLSEVLQKIYSETEFNELPKADLEAVAKQLESSAAYYGVDVETYMYYMYGITEQSDIDKYCEYQVALQYLLAKIVQSEKMEISDEEYKAACDEYCSQYGFETLEALEEAVGASAIKNMIYVEKINDFIVKNWTVEVKE